MHIDGDLRHRQEFVDKNKGFDWTDTGKENRYNELSFHASVPVPKKIITANTKNTNSKKNNVTSEGWYAWCNKNWGTKWDCYDEELVHEQEYTYYSYTTAWSPPTEWVEKVSRKFPHLKFNVEWGEEGGCGGRVMVERGHLVFCEEMSDQEWKNFMGFEDDDE